MKKLFFPILMTFIIVLVVSSCSKNQINNNNSDLTSITLSYKDIATSDDFEKYNMAYSDNPEIKVELKKDNFYLIKVNCQVENKSDKKLSGLDFVPYKDKNVLYEIGAIDIEPTYPILANSTESFDAYIYVDNSLDSKEKIIKALENTEFNFTAFSYKDLPLDEYSTKINLQGKYFICN